MKNRSIPVFLFFLLLIIPFISSAEIISNDNFSQGETFIAKLSGIFTEKITEDDLFMFRIGDTEEYIEKFGNGKDDK